MKKPIIWILVGIAIFGIAYYLWTYFRKQQLIKDIISICTDDVREKDCGAIENDEKSKKQLRKLPLTTLVNLYQNITGSTIAISDWSSDVQCQDGCDKNNSGYDCNGFPSSDCGFARIK